MEKAMPKRKWLSFNAKYHRVCFCNISLSVIDKYVCLFRYREECDAYGILFNYTSDAMEKKNIFCTNEFKAKREISSGCAHRSGEACSRHHLDHDNNLE